MGAWGTGLYSDDVAQDIKSEYIDLLKQGKSNEEATRLLIQSNKDLIEDEADGPVFWYALADTQWHYGRLLPSVLEQALKYIELKTDLKKWVNTTPKDYKQREKVLFDLEVKLKSPMPAEKKVSQYRYFKCTWKIGDVYAYRLESDYAKEHSFEGRYLLIQKIDEYRYEKGDGFDLWPIVYTKITKGIEKPKTEADFHACDFIRYLLSNKIRLYQYRTANDTSSPNIQKKLIYIGNYKIFQPGEDIQHKNYGFPIDNMSVSHYEKIKINEFIKNN